MKYISSYNSPLGEILLASDEKALIGLWFYGERFYPNLKGAEFCRRDTEAIKLAKKWLDVYFEGKEPDFMPPLNPIGGEFRQTVWKILRKIPYGETTTYNAIAREIASNRGIEKMSAQAVGGAVGHNEISIIIPCHRVIGANSCLTGYAGGIDKKISLLKLEGCDVTRFNLPKK